MPDDQLDFVPISLSSLRIRKEYLSNKASSYAAGGFARVYYATLAKESNVSVPVALKELQKPISNLSEEKVFSLTYLFSIDIC